MNKVFNKALIKFKPKKIFIAGGTGFLGKHLVARIKKDKIPYVAASLSKGVDFRDIKQLDRFFKKEKPDVVINASAFVGGIQFGYQKPGEIYFNNTLINTNLIEGSRRAGVYLFVNPIPNCSYPDVLDKKLEENEWWDGPLHESVLSYGLTRKASWVNAWAYNKQYGMRFINLIFPNMYGPGDHTDEVRCHALGALVKKFIIAKRNKVKEVIVWGTGKPVREWLYVEDAAEAIMRALKIEPTIDPINIGSGTGVSIKKLALLIKDVVGYKGKLVFDTNYPDGAPYKIMGVKRCKKVFGWLPSTNLKRGTKKTVKYFDSVI
ncbi:MAG: NAD-dependent epimerase/dehydratase family protein [bacterium]|nr:NAD-dependent epimerase/dehydratase family protein [bacterium]